jgi:hypothetical protein
MEMGHEIEILTIMATAMETGHEIEMGIAMVHEMDDHDDLTLATPTI